jgi:nucleotide-binding universal stress UspA family protein
MFKTIVWATDGSDNSDRALSYAKELAQAKGAKLVVAHCKEILTGRAGGLPVRADESDLVGKIHAQAAELRSVGFDVETEIVTSHENAAHVIAQIAAEVGGDVIVVGTRGQTAFLGLLVGSVTQRLLHVAHCPVLAVPSAKHAGLEEPEPAGTAAAQ